MLAAVINFCSNESCFLDACIREVRTFARQIIIPICDHFFDGSEEDRELLEQIYRAYPDCLFVEYPFIRRRCRVSYWHNASRFIGASFLEHSIETVLFLDADEVPNGSAFHVWLQCHQENRVVKLSNYWYFREPKYQALSWEDSVVWVQRQHLTQEMLLHPEERNAIYDLVPTPKRRNVVGLDGRPMFHHFSWVRTKDAMLRKVQTWGHKEDRNWTELVEREFSTDFQGTDFVHGYQYQTVVPTFSLEPRTFVEQTQTPQVIRLREKDLMALLRGAKA